MQTRSCQLLTDATGQLMQQHAFDHLTDEKLLRISTCMHRLRQSGNDAGLAQIQEELLGLCCEADLFTDTVTPGALNQWLTTMSCLNTSTGYLQAKY